MLACFIMYKQAVRGVFTVRNNAPGLPQFRTMQDCVLPHRVQVNTIQQRLFLLFWPVGVVEYDLKYYSHVHHPYE